jgi:fumarate reductase iron-sulfur subunit
MAPAGSKTASPDADCGTLKVEVWRGTSAGSFQTFEVQRRDKQTVLDVVTTIQRDQDATLSYRFACRVGMCGSCAMTVNGSPRWTCRTQVSQAAQGGRLRLEPLRNFTVVKDLAIDMVQFFDKWTGAKGFFEPGRPKDSVAAKDLDFAVVSPESKERQAANEGIECIGCGICYAACDVVHSRKDYFGPAALNRAWTLVNDVRDGGQEERLDAVAGDGGCHACHTHMSCTRLCPKHIAPTYSIAGLKRAVLLNSLRGRR